MSIDKEFSSDIPKDHQIYERRLEVAGVQHRKSSAYKFAKGSCQEIYLEREYNNKYDSNAIKMMGVSKGWFFTSRNFIGYVPKEISQQIVGSDMWDSVKPRLCKIYISDKGFVDIKFQLLGYKNKKHQYDDYLKNKPPTQIQKEFYKYFGIKKPKGLTTGQAEEFINITRKNNQIDSDKKLEDWDAYEEICEEFSDADFRETYEIKKVGMPLLRDAINQLLKDGETMPNLSKDIDKIVEKIISIKPEIERK